MTVPPEPAPGGPTGPSPTRPPWGGYGRGPITIAVTVVVVALIAAVAWVVSSLDDDDDGAAPRPAASSPGGQPSASTGAPETAAPDAGPVGTGPRNATPGYGAVYDAEAAGGTSSPDPVVVTVYEDFQCPICRSFQEQSGELLDDAVESGEITVEFRPISFLDRASGNEYSSRAANAALCVLDEGGVSAFKAMHDLLFANQPDEGTDGPDDAELIGRAREAGATDVEACITDKAFGDWLDEAMESARDNGLTGTPFVVVDGTTVEDVSPGSLQAAIDAARQKTTA